MSGSSLKKRNITFRLEQKAIEKLEAIATEKGIKKSELLRQIVREWLERRGLE